MFEDEEAGDPDNWIMQFNNIVGGVCHQHPHCDSGRVGTYQDLTVFPFVALHGFGLHTFSLWLLPQGLDYGFMHEFNADQIVFMRGDFVHASVPSTATRGHMEFFPFLQQVGIDGIPSGCEVTAKSPPFRGNTLQFH